MSTFAKDIEKGLSSPKKYSSSKYFYDDAGSRIFQQIMEMPEYYLTESEYEILQFQSTDIHNALQFDQHFNIIELGAGDGLKTQKLLGYLVENEVDFTYIPVDISSEAISLLEEKLSKKLPALSIKPMVGDYFKILQEEISDNADPNLILFLGSNIGNYIEKEAEDLLSLFNQSMNSNDKLLIGIDLQKNPITIHKAYYDPHGITKKFNLNLLARINRELGGNFMLDQFDFYCHYDPRNGEVRSYLVSIKKQEVYLKSLDRTFQFQQNELIATEVSKKYSLKEIEELAKKTGFELQQHFLDCKHYFTDSLWVKR